MRRPTPWKMCMEVVGSNYISQQIAQCLGSIVHAWRVYLRCKMGLDWQFQPPGGVCAHDCNQWATTIERVSQTLLGARGAQVERAAGCPRSCRSTSGDRSGRRRDAQACRCRIWTTR